MISASKFSPIQKQIFNHSQLHVVAAGSSLLREFRGIHVLADVVGTVLPWRQWESFFHTGTRVFRMFLWRGVHPSFSCFEFMLCVCGENTIPPGINSNDFGGFEINWQIRIRILSSRKLFFLKDSNFLVRSCECAVACLCPRNSISNVVASAIHDERNIHFNETIVEGRANRSLNLGFGWRKTNRTLIVKVVHNKRG